MGYILLTTGREFYRLWLKVAKSELAILIQDPKIVSRCEALICHKTCISNYSCLQNRLPLQARCWNVAPLLPNSALGARLARYSKALNKAAMSKSTLSGLT